MSAHRCPDGHESGGERDEERRGPERRDEVHQDLLDRLRRTALTDYTDAVVHEVVLRDSVAVRFDTGRGGWAMYPPTRSTQPNAPGSGQLGSPTYPCRRHLVPVAPGRLTTVSEHQCESAPLAPAPQNIASPAEGTAIPVAVTAIRRREATGSYIDIADACPRRRRLAVVALHPCPRLSRSSSATRVRDSLLAPSPSEAPKKSSVASALLARRGRRSERTKRSVEDRTEERAALLIAASPEPRRRSQAAEVGARSWGRLPGRLCDWGDRPSDHRHA